MTDAEILTMSKANLQLLTPAFDTFLSQLIAVSKTEIEREGITLDLDDIADCNLVVMYTSFLYRRRAENNENTAYWTEANQYFDMPRMLRHALNNRLFSQKMRTTP